MSKNPNNDEDLNRSENEGYSVMYQSEKKQRLHSDSEKTEKAFLKPTLPNTILKMKLRNFWKRFRSHRRKDKQMGTDKNKFYVLFSICFLLVVGCRQTHPSKEPADFEEYIDNTIPNNEEIVNEFKIKASF